MKKILPLFVLIACNSFAQSSNSQLNLRSKGCDPITQKYCKDIYTDHCEGVYVTMEPSTPACKKRSSDNIQKVCGKAKAQLFDTGKACVFSAQPKSKPQKKLNELVQADAPRIYTYATLHADLCRELCGVRYDKSDVRDFNQTGHRPGLLCIDDGWNDEKNGMKTTDDPNRKKCSEQHSGNYSWCITYDKNYNGIHFDSYVQCAARISQKISDLLSDMHE